jgi:glycosyltransferase involved in cell wall biosynthesis
MDNQIPNKRNIFIVGPTESIMTMRGNRHPALAQFLVNDGYQLEYITSNFYHAEKIWFSDQTINIAKKNAPYKLTVLKCLGYKTNISIRRIFSNTLLSLKIFAYLFLRLDKASVLIIPSRPVELIFISSLLRLLKGSSVVLDIQDIWPDMLEIKSKSKRLLFNIYCNAYLYPSLRHIDKFMHVAPSFTNWLARYSKYSSSEFIPLGFDANRWQRISPDNKTISDTPINIVCVGMLQYQINVMPILIALNGRSDFHLTIIGDDGDGERYNEVFNYVEKCSMTNVTFIGQIKPQDMQDYLKNMDIGVLPMISSSIPNKIFDYIAAYLPILVLGEGDSASFVVNQNIGWSVGFTSDDVVSFLDKLQIDDIVEKSNRIPKIRDLYDRKILFQKAKILIDS